MTVEEIEKRIAERIVAEAGDDEVQHINEDRLRHDVLLAIAEGASNPDALAKAVLKTSDLDFARWCA